MDKRIIANRKRIKKTYEELYGIERALQIKAKQSKAQKGVPDGPQSAETIRKKRLIMKKSAKRGSEHYRYNYHYTTDEKKQLSQRSTFGLLKYYSKNSGSRITGGHWSKDGRRVDLDNQYFRSTWEANVARLLNFLKVFWIYEPGRFSLYDENDDLICTYKPDFFLPGCKVYLEVTGRTFGNKLRKLDLFSKKYNLVVIDQGMYVYLKEWISNVIPFWENPQRLYAKHLEMNDDIVQTACIDKDADLNRNDLGAT